MDNQQTSPPRLAELGELVGATWRNALWLLKVMWPYFAAVFAFNTAIPILAATAFGKESVSALVASAPSMLIGFLLSLFIPVLAMLFFRARETNVPATFSYAFSSLLKLALPYLFVGVLQGLVTIGPALFLAAAAVGVFVVGSLELAGALLIVVAVLAIFIVVIPTSIRLMFSSFALVFEERRGFDALLRSAGLVLGHGWPVFWRLLGFGLLLFFVATVLQVPLFFFGIGQSGFTFPDISGDAQQPTLASLLSPRSSLSEFWSGLVGLALAPVGITFTFVLFGALRSFKGDAFAEEKRKTYRFFMILAIIGLIILMASGIFLLMRIGRTFL